MRLLKLGNNAYVLESETGSVLFSYEKPVAVRHGGNYFWVSQRVSTATRAHLNRFAPVFGGLDSDYMAVAPREFARYVSLVVNAGVRALEANR